MVFVSSEMMRFIYLPSYWLHQLRYVLRRFRVSIFCIISWDLSNTLLHSEEKLKDQQKLTQANAHKMVFFQLISVLWKQPNQNQRDYMARDHSPAWSVSSTVRNFCICILYLVFSTVLFCICILALVSSTEGEDHRLNQILCISFVSINWNQVQSLSTIVSNWLKSQISGLKKLFST